MTVTQIGKTSIGGTPHLRNANNYAVNKITLPADLTLVKMSFYCQSLSPMGSVAMLFDNDGVGGLPKTLLRYAYRQLKTGGDDDPVALDWYHYDFDIDLTAGDYYMGLDLAASGQLTQYYDDEASGTLLVTIPGGYFPGNFDAGQAEDMPIYGTARYSMYATCVSPDAYSQAVKADGAIGFWKLSEKSGPYAVDSKGIQDGTHTNPAGIILNQTGIAGCPDYTATKFVSVDNGYVNIPSNAGQFVWAGNDGATLEAWVKRASGSDYGTVFSKSPGGGGPQFDIDSSGHIALGSSFTAGLATSTAVVPADGNFHYIAATKVGSAIHLRIDSTDETFSNPTGIEGQGWYIGHLDASYFNGTLAMVALYPTALSGTKLTNHYSLGSPAIAAPNSAFLGFM